jgi:uncharacterized membrane protein
MVKKSDKKSESKGFAFIATFLSIVGFIVALIVRKNDKYVMFYAKQSLVLFIFSAIIGVLASIFAFLPLIGTLIVGVVNVLTFVLWVLSWVYALSGKMKELPLIGSYANKFDF